MAQTQRRQTRPPPNAVDLYQVVEGDRHEYVGPYLDERAAKQASRIAYRGGARCAWLAVDRRTGMSAVQWEVVGNPRRPHGADCVDTWRADDSGPPTAPASAQALPAVRNRVGFLLTRLAQLRRKAA